MRRLSFVACWRLAVDAAATSIAFRVLRREPARQ
jgi:hypothetical protein